MQFIAVFPSLEMASTGLVHILQVYMACSPDSETYMLVREPDTCKYAVTLYHPSLCKQDKYALRTVQAPAAQATEAQPDSQEKDDYYRDEL